MTRLTITRVGPAERPVLESLLNLYLYELSDLTGEAIGPDGRYDYPYLDLYWREAGRYPFLLWYEGQLAGFALVRTVEFGQDPLYHVTEFFILRAHRRQGIGRAVARDLFDRLTGRWRVSQMANNTAAQTFWRRVIAEYTGDNYEEQWDAEVGGPQQQFRTREPRSTVD